MRLTRLFCWLLLLLPGIDAGAQSALQLSQRVADKVIRDTRFSFSLVARPDVLGMQIIDFRSLAGRKVAGTRAFIADKKGSFTIGISSGMPFSLYNGEKLLYKQTSGIAAKPYEYAYNRFRFDTIISVELNTGVNQLHIEAERTAAAPLVFLRWVTAAGDIDNSVRAAIQPAGWLITETGENTVAYPPAGKLAWQLTPQYYIAELDTDSNAAYRRDPYSDWHYSHGALVWSIQRLGNFLNDTVYTGYGNRYANNLLDHLDYFRWQYDSLFAYRGSYHRIFRSSMLDDAGAPSLPFFMNNDRRSQSLLDTLSTFIMKRQQRLPDGTFCRPEPVAYTVWADDLFMSVPFLLGMTKRTGDETYRSEAIKQVLGFARYINDPQTGLYYHGFFYNTGRPSGVFWGRANGWVAWAMAELLDDLSPKHPQYKAVLKLFTAHMKSLLRYQESDGSWHQVLDKKETYKETSCTALFTLAMARGVRRGWLPASFAAPAKKGWSYVASQINEQGIVKGICQGTEIGEEVSFYEKRKTIDNDPRGLGAVITAGIEITRLQK